jgi:hypothetical protein
MYNFPTLINNNHKNWVILFKLTKVGCYATEPAGLYLFLFFLTGPELFPLYKDHLKYQKLTYRAVSSTRAWGITDCSKTEQSLWFTGQPETI